jgi:hypothetical protein
MPLRKSRLRRNGLFVRQNKTHEIMQKKHTGWWNHHFRPAKLSVVLRHKQNDMKRSLIHYLLLMMLTISMYSIKAQAPATVTDSSHTARSKDLKTVTVTAIKPFVTIKSNRIVLNVAGSPVAAGANAWDIVLRAPGVTDGGGALQTGGKKLTVLIDGRYTNLNGDELKNLLTGMPANGIDKIELISNPSAKYDARGGAVLNIITTKNKKFGTNGTITAGLAAGRYAGYNGGVALNYRNQQFNAYGSVDYQYNERYSDKQSDRNVTADNRIIEHTREVYERKNYSFKGGIDYTINSRNSLGILVKGMLNDRDKNGETNSLNDRPGWLNDSMSGVTTTGYARFIIPSVNIWYKLIADTTGRELNIQADYFSYRKKWNDHFSTRYLNSHREEYTLPYLLRDQSPANNTVQSVSVDYSHPTRMARIETGIKTTFTTTDNNILWEQLQNNDWIRDAGKTNHFVYHENIHALYVNLGKTIKKLELQLGVRGEQTNTKGISETLHQTHEHSYINFFPHLSLLYNSSKDQQFGFSYRKSIERFQFDVVNPFIVYKSQYSYYQGNPAIQPSIAHNFELTHNYKNEWLTTIGYSRYINTLAEVYKRDSITAAVINTSENLGTGDYISGSIMWSKNMFNGKWSATNTVNAFYAKYNTPMPGYNNSAVTVYFSSQNMVLLAKGLRGELNASYYSPAVIGAARFKSSWSVNIGLAKTILNNNGTVTLNLTDVFNTQVYRYNITAAGALSTDRSKTESRFVKLVFTYRFGNKQVKKAASRKTGIETERRRMGE